MRKEIVWLVAGAMLLVWSAVAVRADALLRAWAESGNGVPVKLAVKGVRGAFPAGSIQTVYFSLANPQPRRTIPLQASAVYTLEDGRQEASRSNSILLEVDNTARNCRIYLYVINGYALEDTLFLGGQELYLPYNSSFVEIPVPELPASAVVQGRVSIYAK
jgi:hypothetical protein